jgi:hypothetical protein
MMPRTVTQPSQRYSTVSVDEILGSVTEVGDIWSIAAAWRTLAYAATTKRCKQCHELV